MTNNNSPERIASHRDRLGPPLDALARRLDDLERQNRRLKQTLVAAVVLAAAAGARAQVPPPAVTADRFALVDAQSRTRATLDMAVSSGAGGVRYPVLTFLDPGGKPRLRLGLGSRGGLLEVTDENGKVRDYFGPFTARPLTQP